MAAPKKRYKLEDAAKQYGETYGLRHHFFILGGMPEPLPPKPLSELSDTEKAKLKIRSQNLKKHMPEFVPFVKELIAEGMMPGMRNVRVRANK